MLLVWLFLGVVEARGMECLCMLMFVQLRLRVLSLWDAVLKGCGLIEDDSIAFGHST